MIRGDFPNGIGNVKSIKSERIKGHIFPIKRLEDLFDFFSEEPASIFVKKNENSERECFRRVLLIRVWRQKHYNFSWSIYSKERENFDSLIIRKVIWDLDKDTKLYQEIVREKQMEIPEYWPSIEIRNMYITQKQARKIVRLINKLDSEIKNGFVLRKKSNPVWEWRDLEILRSYKKGQIHFTWGSRRENTRVQNKIKKLVLELDISTQKMNTNIFEMVLNYSRDPEAYKNEECMIIQNPCNR